MFILSNSPLGQFNIIPLLPFNISWLDFTFTNSSLALVFVGIFFYLFINFSTSNATVIPTRWQSAVELVYEFVYNLIQEQIGVKGNKYFPFIFTIFAFILFTNLLGMIPYSFTPTSHLTVAIGLSVAIFIGVTIIGFVTHGLHFFSFFLPSGVPAALAPLIIVIEVISYLVRALSLGVRLAANMFAGHTLLKILATFAWQMFAFGGLIAVAGLAPLALVFALTGLEIGVAALQAYVFTVLTCSYLNDAINLH
jgi:ATP synthase subunit 6